MAQSAREDRSHEVLKLEVSGDLVPYLIHTIIYDKLLERYSIHQYQLETVADGKASGHQPVLLPRVLHSRDLIAQYGIDELLQLQANQRLSHPFHRYVLTMKRIARPMGKMNNVNDSFAEKLKDPLTQRELRSLDSIIEKFRPRMIEKSPFLE